MRNFKMRLILGFFIWAFILFFLNPLGILSISFVPFLLLLIVMGLTFGWERVVGYLKDKNNQKNRDT